MFQSQFRFDNECHISLPENHKRVSADGGDTNALSMQDVVSVRILICFPFNLVYLSLIISTSETYKLAQI